MGAEAFGRLLARLRRERGLSQAQLAQRLVEVSGDATITRNEVSRYERGVRSPRWWLPHYARALGVPVEELRRALMADRPHRGASDEPSVGRIETVFPVDAVGVASGGDDAADTYARIAHVVDHPTRLDAAAVAALAESLALHRRLDDSLPATLLLPIVGAQHRMVSVLARDARGPHAAALYPVVAEWTQFLGWLYASARNDDQAIQILTVAGEQARRVADGTLQAQAENFLGYVDRQRAHPGGIAEHFLAAYQTPGANTHQRIGDAAQAAHGYALLADRTTADRLLAEASDLTERVDTVEPPPTAYWLSPTFHRMGIGLAWLALGEIRRGADNLRAGLDGIPDEQAGAEWTREYHDALASTGY